MKIVLFDIDGVLADNAHRLHYIEQTPKDYEAFYAAMVDDTPIEPMVDLHNNYLYCGQRITYCTGRPERYRTITERWMLMKMMDWTGDAAHLWRHQQSRVSLHMRPDGDHRPAVEYKREVLERIGVDNILIAFEDDPRIIEMYRSLGIYTVACPRQEGQTAEHVL